MIELSMLVTQITLKQIDISNIKKVECNVTNCHIERFVCSMDICYIVDKTFHYQSYTNTVLFRIL